MGAEVLKLCTQLRGVTRLPSGSFRCPHGVVGYDSEDDISMETCRVTGRCHIVFAVRCLIVKNLYLGFQKVFFNHRRFFTFHHHTSQTTLLTQCMADIEIKVSFVFFPLNKIFL